MQNVDYASNSTEFKCSNFLSVTKIQKNWQWITLCSVTGTFLVWLHSLFFFIYVVLLSLIKSSTNHLIYLAQLRFLFSFKTNKCFFLFFDLKFRLASKFGRNVIKLLLWGEWRRNRILTMAMDITIWREIWAVIHWSCWTEGKFMLSDRIFIFMTNCVIVHVLNLKIFLKRNLVSIFGLLKNMTKLYTFASQFNYICSLSFNNLIKFA